MLTFFLKSFKRTRANIFDFWHKRLPTPSYQTEPEFLKNFTLPTEQLVLAADKNIGFVCIDVVDVLYQYEKISIQQHLWKVTLDAHLLTLTLF